MSSTQSLPQVILVKDLCILVEAKRVGPSWMDPIILFLKKDKLLEDKYKADKVWRKAPRIWLSED